MTHYSPDASFWDLDACIVKHDQPDTNNAVFDVAIVGGGILGCAIARTFQKQTSQLRVVVVERGSQPVGASTRNAGFACFGSVGEIAADIDAMGSSAALELVQRRVDGLRILRSHVSDEEMGYQHDGGNEIFLSDDPALERIAEVNTLLSSVFPTPPFSLRDDLIQSFGLSSDVRHLIHTPYEGMLHSGKLLKSMQHENVVTGNVQRIEHGTDGLYTLQLLMDLNEHDANFTTWVQARYVILATNAWLPELAPEVHVVPARGQVLVTKPIPSLKLRGTFHMNAGYVYFRNIGDRVLLGGGRNLAFQAERTKHMVVTDTIQEYLNSLLNQVIVPYETPQIEMCWSGIMAFTENKQPFVTQVGDGMWAAMTCNGMGVALASKTAADVAAVVLQHDSRT